MSRFLRKICRLPVASDMPVTDTSDKTTVSKKANPTTEVMPGKTAVTVTTVKETTIKEVPSLSTQVPSPSSSTNGNSDATLLLERKMTGKKITSKERPDDNARQLASTLTLEEQVWIPLTNVYPETLEN